MQNPAFWCTLGSENGQLLAGVDPEGRARERGFGGERGDAEGIDVRGTKAPSRRRWKRRQIGAWWVSWVPL